jgi:uncharacterized protein with FMN-binding domain
MRRAVVVLGTTAAGLAALFSYKTHVAGIAVASASPAIPTIAAPVVSPSASASPSESPARKSAPKPSTAHRTTTAPTPAATHSTAPTKTPTSSAPKTSAPAGKSGTFTGPAENTQYGNVQVTLTVADGKITNANGSLPGGGDSIGQNAIPQLNQEVLTAQSASIQAVSGATYTSDGYIESLQRAVDQAGL